MRLLRSVYCFFVMLLALSTPSSEPELYPQPLLPRYNATPRLSQPDAKTRARLHESYGKLPLSSEANQGQADSAVRFRSYGSRRD